MHSLLHWTFMELLHMSCAFFLCPDYFRKPAQNFTTAFQWQLVPGFRVLEEVFGCLPLDKTRKLGRMNLLRKIRDNSNCWKSCLRHSKVFLTCRIIYIYIRTHIYDIMDRTDLQGTHYLHRQPAFEVMALLENLSSWTWKKYFYVQVRWVRSICQGKCSTHEVPLQQFCLKEGKRKSSQWRRKTIRRW